MAGNPSIAKSVFGLLVMVGVAWGIRNAIAPADTYIYGPDGKWLQDGGSPNRAFDLHSVGHVATWSGAKWVDNNGGTINLGPPPPPGWKQDEKTLVDAVDSSGKKASFDEKTQNWYDRTGKSVWQVSNKSKSAF